MTRITVSAAISFLVYCLLSLAFPPFSPIGAGVAVSLSIVLSAFQES
jgi:hypothetical protein